MCVIGCVATFDVPCGSVMWNSHGSSQYKNVTINEVAKFTKSGPMFYSHAWRAQDIMTPRHPSICCLPNCFLVCYSFQDISTATLFVILLPNIGFISRTICIGIACSCNVGCCQKICNATQGFGEFYR